MTFLPVFKRHTNLWLFYQFSNDILTYDFFTSFQTTYKPMTFLPVFKRHTNLWLFHQFSNDIQTYVFKRHTNLWLFYQFSNDIQTYDFFPSFRTAKKTTYKPMTFWLFSQFSDGKKNDIQTYDFFPSFRTAKKTTYKPMTFFPVFGRHKKRHTNLWLFYQFSETTYDFFKNDMTFFTSFNTNLWVSSVLLTSPENFTSFQTTYKPMTFLPVFGRQKKTTYKPMTFFPVFGRQKKRHTNLWLFLQFSLAKKTTYKPMTFLPVFNLKVVSSIPVFTAKKTTY